LWAREQPSPRQAGSPMVPIAKPSSTWADTRTRGADDERDGSETWFQTGTRRTKSPTRVSPAIEKVLSTIARVARSFAVEDHHTEEALEHLAKYEGLEHVRARRRADLTTFESGPKDDVVPHTRLRRVGVHRWQIEMPC
jgi:hypothetical protein